MFFCLATKKSWWNERIIRATRATMQWACQVVKWMVQPITSGCNEKRNGLPWCLSNVFCDSEKTQIESRPQKVVEDEDDAFLLGCIYWYWNVLLWSVWGWRIGFPGYIYIYIHMFQSGLESLSDVINSFFYIPFHPLPSRCILLHSKERSQNSNKIKLLMFGLLFC